MFLWNKEHILDLIVHNSKVILPIILPALEKNTNGHWSQAVQCLSLTLRQLLSDRDPEVFAECLRNCEEGKAKEELRLKQEAAWKRLVEMTSVKVTVGEAVLVFRALPRQY
jgi:serine/threonine-protein phosphatase 2A regulatory subunit B'